MAGVLRVVVGALGATAVLGPLASTAAQERPPARDGAADASAVLPFPARVEPVIERGDIEGHAVSITRFRSALSAESIVARVARDWSGPLRDPVVESATGPWRVISTRSHEAWRTLQVRPHPAGGSEGMLSVWAGAPASRSAAADVVALLPADANVLRRLGAVDAGRRSVTVVAEVEGSPGWAAQALDSRLAQAGYARDGVVRTAESAVQRGEARLYRRQGREIAFTVQPHRGRSAVVLHLTESAQ
jgi:hypothetical protein